MRRTCALGRPDSQRTTAAFEVFISQYFSSAVLRSSFVLVFLSSMLANAALMHNATYTTDTVSGLDWLDLTATAGATTANVLTNNTGWRYAANTEVENLFETIFPEYYDNPVANISYFRPGYTAPQQFTPTYSEHSSNLETFEFLFGESSAFGSDEVVWSVGLYRDEDDTFRILGTKRYLEIPLSVIYGTEVIDDRELQATEGRENMGFFLVRPTVVPFPGSVLLGGLGLAIAGWRLRKRKTA